VQEGFHFLPAVRKLGIFLCLLIFLMATEQQKEKPEHKMPATTKIHLRNMKAGKQKR
jgi:hypothetical protein